MGSNELRLKDRLIWAPPMRRREGEKWTVPDVLKGWKNRERGEERKREREKEGKRARKRQGLVVLGSGEENPRVFCSVMLTRNPKRE
ncbi:hypothetical protein TNCV_433981 [Trichonephila clavipes]|nr:hypothetical protein TNCV_433981 [Trichonephila clavipes]